MKAGETWERKRIRGGKNTYPTRLQLKYYTDNDLWYCKTSGGMKSNGLYSGEHIYRNFVKISE